MSSWIKGFAALLLFLSASLCLQRFRAGYAGAEIQRAGLETQESAPEPATEAVSESPADGATKVASAASTNAAATPGTAATNGLTSAATNPVVSAGRTNNAGASSPAAKDAPVAKGKGFPWLAGFVASLIGLAGLLAWEVSRWFSRRTGEVLLSENAPATTDAEYEAAEAEWANGNHLEAVRQMREYLDKNPSQQYAAIRIAEIYEKDLHNYVAATLELEEVLTKRLSREKWGWTAIHLANLYSGKMGQTDKAIALLERIIRDYPETGAAKKARSRLGVAEDAAPSVTAGTPTEPDPEPDPGAPNLPKGFSSKKR
jgi:TolA-binding protein